MNKYLYFNFLLNKHIQYQNIKAVTSGSCKWCIILKLINFNFNLICKNIKPLIRMTAKNNKI